MSEIYLWLKWAHVVSSTVLFGMGAGIAFFFIRAQRTGDVRVIAAVAREVVIADAIFTASAVVLQPVTGLAMVRLAGFPLSLPWLRWSIDNENLRLQRPCPAPAFRLARRFDPGSFLS